MHPRFVCLFACLFRARAGVCQSAFEVAPVASQTAFRAAGPCRTWHARAGVRTTECGSPALRFEPDFRSSLVNQTLLVHSSIGVLEFPIIGTIPYA